MSDAPRPTAEPEQWCDWRRMEGGGWRTSCGRLVLLNPSYDGAEIDCEKCGKPTRVAPEHTTAQLAAANSEQSTGEGHATDSTVQVHGDERGGRSGHAADREAGHAVRRGADAGGSSVQRGDAVGADGVRSEQPGAGGILRAGEGVLRGHQPGGVTTPLSDVTFGRPCEGCGRPPHPGPCRFPLIERVTASAAEPRDPSPEYDGLPERSAEDLWGRVDDGSLEVAQGDDPDVIEMRMSRKVHDRILDALLTLDGRDPSDAEMRERVFNAVWQVMPSWAFDEGGEWSEDDMQRFATEVTDAVLAATPAAPRSPTERHEP